MASRRLVTVTVRLFVENVRDLKAIAEAESMQWQPKLRLVLDDAVKRIKFQRKGEIG